ncbi:hypothetical protein [Roseomonas indoligenes]|uniref:Uncharacterized protein n=1 Tax=Roseomonas indoligenes TaxID=2820811 RepID=A0A940MVY6_9PROT|nr:hypothetical protein [Pararoseomonas indoligenes]MBP0493026.1 hypothetical protein [Pararoseomonas indoligenes]
MDDWTQVLAALGVPALWVTPLVLLARAAWPEVLHALRVWRVDRGLTRAAGFMHSLRVAAGNTSAPLTDPELQALVTRGAAYMVARLGGTLDALKIPPMDLRDMVQGQYGELLAGLVPAGKVAA